MPITHSASALSRSATISEGGRDAGGGEHVDARDKIGRTPLHLIAVSGSAASLSVAKILLEAGADVEAKSDAGWDWTVFWQHGE